MGYRRSAYKSSKVVLYVVYRCYTEGECIKNTGYSIKNRTEVYPIKENQYTSSSSLTTAFVLHRPVPPAQSPSVLGLGLKLSRLTLPPLLEECSEELVDRVDEPSLSGAAWCCVEGTRP